MMPEDQAPERETPLEQAARTEDADDTTRAEQEADRLVADIDTYVAETDPASLPAAEAALNAWQIPEDPRDLGVGAEDGELLEPIFAAGTEAEAAIVRGLLEAQGIPTTLDGLPTRTLGNVFQAGEDRWGDILVPASVAAEARSLIAEAQNTASDGSETSSMLEGEGQQA